MSFDRSDVDENEHISHHRQSDTRSADQATDAPQVRRPTAADNTADIDRERSFRVPTAEERIEAHRKAHQTADAVYSAWNRGVEGHANANNQPDVAAGGESAAAAPEARSRDRADGGGTSRPPDKPSATDEALRERVTELEADKAARDKQLAAQDQKIAEQDKIIAELRSSKVTQDKTIAIQSERIDRLEAYVGQITTAVRELRQDQTPPSTDIGERARGGEAERTQWEKPQHKRLPSDAVNNVIALAVGGAVGDLAFHVQDIPPEAAGITATGFALGAGIIAVWRDRKKGKDG